MDVSFSAYEYHADEIFHEAAYRYHGSSELGWRIYRNGSLIESLPSGYVILKSLYCGICSTDIARAKLPFLLPQITGHEVVALHQNQPVVVDINASHLARGVEHACYYCKHNFASHCPDRLTLGIDRLPGGFAPYILAPEKAIYRLPEKVTPQMAVVVEPFAAALHAVESMGICEGMTVAIVGPKRLGLLLILALNFHRRKRQINFTITAILRRSELSEVCAQFGADHILMTSEIDEEQFDLVYETSGSVSGFGLAIQLAKKIVHVKSTHGMGIAGFTQLTRLVIDELSLLPLNKEYLSVPQKEGGKLQVLVDESLPLMIKSWLKDNVKNALFVEARLGVVTPEEIVQRLPTSGFEKFDVAVAGSMSGVNQVIAAGLVRAKGNIFWSDVNGEGHSLWVKYFKKGLCLTTSRCGDFAKALSLLNDNADFFSSLLPKYITGQFDLQQINQAFDVARSDKKNIKLVINVSESFK